jgi:hypothetical protein
LQRAEKFISSSEKRYIHKEKVRVPEKKQVGFFPFFYKQKRGKFFVCVVMLVVTHWSLLVTGNCCW